PPSGRRSLGNANSQVPRGNDRPGRLFHEHGGRPQRPRVSYARRPTMDRRWRLQTHAPPDRRSPARALRRPVGVPQETVVPRHLELLATVDRDPPPAISAARTPWTEKTAQAVVTKVAKSIGLVTTSFVVLPSVTGRVRLDQLSPAFAMLNVASGLRPPTHPPVQPQGAPCSRFA